MSTGGGAIDEGMGRVVSEVESCALSCEDLGGSCSCLLGLAVNTDGRRMCLTERWRWHVAECSSMPVGGGLVTDTEGVVAWFEDEGRSVDGWVRLL